MLKQNDVMFATDVLTLVLQSGDDAHDWTAFIIAGKSPTKHTPRLSTTRPPSEDYVRAPATNGFFVHSEPVIALLLRDLFAIAKMAVLGVDIRIGCIARNYLETDWRWSLAK